MKEKTTYLKEFKKYKIAYLPIGTIEWHGNHLPIETDFLVALKICEAVAQKIPGYVLPPFYLGTDKSQKIKGEELRGMDRYLGKKLPGSLYYLTPDILYRTIKSLVENLISQGFERIVIVTGHAGSKQVETIQKIKNMYKPVIFINPFSQNISKKANTSEHAGAEEISLFWACYPEEVQKSVNMKIPKNDDYFEFAGLDPRKKASLRLGQKILNEIVNKIIQEKIKKALNKIA